jgi:hypothetical protein
MAAVLVPLSIVRVRRLHKDSITLGVQLRRPVRGGREECWVDVVAILEERFLALGDDVQEVLAIGHGRDGMAVLGYLPGAQHPPVRWHEEILLVQH